MAGIDGIAPNERQLNLLMALVQTRSGLRKNEILRTVPGYGGAEDTAAANKMFTRDLGWLRAAGIVVDSPLTQDEPDFSAIDDKEAQKAARREWEDTQRSLTEEFRYKISNQSFEWPKGFYPTAIQSRLLQLAAQAWAGSSLGEEMDFALTRLAAIGDVADPDTLTEIIAAFRPIDDVYLDIAAAIEASKTIQFTYRKPQGIVGERLVSPWKFINAEGEWMLQGWDHNANASRNFLLKRIVNRKVSAGGAPYVAATKTHLDAAERDLAEFQSKNIAKIRVTPGTVAWNHFNMDSELGDVKTFTFMDYEILAQTLRRFGASIRVLEPQVLRDEVARGLKLVEQAHA